MQTRAVDLYVLGRKHYECPQTSKRLCEVTQGHKKLRHYVSSRPFYTSFGSTHTHAHTHTHKQVSVITAFVVAASSFPQEGRKTQSFPRTPAGFSVHWVRSKFNDAMRPCDRSEVETWTSVHQIVPLLLGFSLKNSTLTSCLLFTVVKKPRMKRPLRLALIQSESVHVASWSRDWLESSF